MAPIRDWTGAITFFPHPHIKIPPENAIAFSGGICSINRMPYFIIFSERVVPSV